LALSVEPSSTPHETADCSRVAFVSIADCLTPAKASATPRKDAVTPAKPMPTSAPRMISPTREKDEPSPSTIASSRPALAPVSDNALTAPSADPKIVIFRVRVPDMFPYFGLFIAAIQSFMNWIAARRSSAGIAQ
jgi:hypothetical protein